jgi:hypothetical protein
MFVIRLDVRMRGGREGRDVHFVDSFVESISKSHTSAKNTNQTEITKFAVRPFGCSQQVRRRRRVWPVYQ